MESRNKKKAPCLAVFGTGSDVGKSIVATAICRFFVNKIDIVGYLKTDG